MLTNHKKKPEREELHGMLARAPRSPEGGEEAGSRVIEAIQILDLINSSQTLDCWL